MSNDNNANDPMNFVKNMWGNMGFSLPGMVTPTFDVEEIEKKVKDMKAVEGWLKMNLSMLQMTIQSLEMQCATLNAVRTMGDMASNAGRQEPAASFFTTPPTPPGEGGDTQGPAAMWPWTLMQQMQEQMQQAAAEKAAAAAAEESAKPAPKRSKKSQ